MALSADDVCRRVDGLHLDDLDLVVTRDGDGFAVAEHRFGPGAVDDIGSCFEVPASADEHGRAGFTAGPWTAYQYHASYVSPRRDNYFAELEELAEGVVDAVVVGVAGISDNNTWVLGIRTVGP